MNPLPEFPGPVFTNKDQAEQKKSAQDKISIKKIGSDDLWLKSVFTKGGSPEPKNWKYFT